MRAGLAFSIGALLAAGFAGCVGEAESAGLAGGASQARPAAPGTFDESTGAIEGVITNDEFVPIASAQVGLLTSAGEESPATTLTDGVGKFSLSLVPPGNYVLAGQALGYEAASRRITVQAGEITDGNMILVPLPVDEAFYVPEVRKAAVTAVMVKLTPTCMYNIANQGSSAKTCQGLRADCEPSANCEIHYTSMLEKQADKGNNWTTIMGEVTWSSQSAATGRGFMFDITAPNTPRGTGGSIDQSSPYTFFKMQPSPPIRWNINSDLLTERKIPEKDWCCDWFYRLFGGWCDLEAGLVNNCETTPDYGFANANPATIYMTFFFKERAPDGWTALPDN